MGKKDSDVKSEGNEQQIDPDIVEQVKAQLTEELNQLSVKELAETLPEICAKIKAQVTAEMNHIPANLQVPGLLLEVKDPFADGTARTFAKLAGCDVPSLPCVIPFKDKHAKAAIENYIVRAEGGGDKERADAAHKALSKVK